MTSLYSNIRRVTCSDNRSPNIHMSVGRTPADRKETENSDFSRSDFVRIPSALRCHPEHRVVSFPVVGGIVWMYVCVCVWRAY